MFELLWRIPTMRKIDKIIIHCSATPPSLDIGAGDIRRWHMEPPNNWSDIGYHLVITRDGDVEEGRPMDVTGAHVRGHNKGSIGICLVGGVNNTMMPEDNFTKAQWKSLTSVLRILKADYKNATIHGHNEFSDKACPSFDVQHELREGRLYGV